jgi:secreted Zn-dependent insulinase-like peptidase
MSVCILTNKPLNEIRPIAEQYFSEIPNLNLAISDLSLQMSPAHSLPFSVEGSPRTMLNSLYFMKSIEDDPLLKLVFNFPGSIDWAYHTKPIEMINEIIESQTKGSLTD